MRAHRTISIVLAALFLLAQTWGVAAHCAAPFSGADHEHHGMTNSMHGHGHGNATAALEPAHDVIGEHSHSKSGDTMPEMNPGVVSSGCTMGCIGVAAATVGDFGPGSSKLQFIVWSDKTRDSALLLLPTPPPDAVL